jgi:hypothetical protein
MNSARIGKKLCRIFFYISQALVKYYSITCLLVETLTSNSDICKAILKYAHSKFKFEIIEYCDSGVLIEKQQH